MSWTIVFIMMFCILCGCVWLVEEELIVIRGCLWFFFILIFVAWMISIAV